MKRIMNKMILLSLLLLMSVGAKGKKSGGKNQGGHTSGLTVMPSTITPPAVGVVQPAGQNQSIAPQPLTAGAVNKLFDEEKHLAEKVQRAKAYSALQFVALECMHTLEALDRIGNKVGLDQAALMQSANPNTVLGKAVAVKYPDISNVGGFGYYLHRVAGFVGKGVSGTMAVSGQPVTQQPVVQVPQQPIGMFMTQERSREIITVQNFIKKWTDANTYLTTRPDDQIFLADIKASYLFLKNLVRKYLDKDLRSLILNSPDRINNEISALIAILNNNLIPVLTNNFNDKVPYENLKNKINSLGYNARYIFGIVCQCLYSDGSSTSDHNAKNWAQNGIK